MWKVKWTREQLLLLNYQSDNNEADLNTYHSVWITIAGDEQWAFLPGGAQEYAG